MKKRLAAFVVPTVAIVGLSSFLGLGPWKYHLVNAKLTPHEVCGVEEGRCDPGNFGILFSFRDPYSPNVKEGTTKRDVAISLIGRCYDEEETSGETPQVPAEEGDQNPFKPEDIEENGSVSGRDLTYSKKTKSNLKINAAVQANLDDIKKALPTITIGQLDQISVELKTAYEKVRGSEITVSANYSEWELTQDVVSDIKRGLTKYSKCKTYLINHKQRMITSIGLVYYNISYNSSSLDDLASSIDTKLKVYNIPVSVGVSFKRQVSTSIDAKYQNGFQVVAWKTVEGTKFGHQ